MITTLEIFLWIVAGIVIAEGIFILLCIFDCSESWVGRKITSLFIAWSFTIVNFAIVWIDDKLGKLSLSETPRWDALGLCYLVLLVIGLFFLINYLIYKKIEKIK